MTLFFKCYTSFIFLHQWHRKLHLCHLSISLSSWCPFVCPSVSLLMFLRICRQTTDGVWLKFGLINSRSCLAEFLTYPGLSLVVQFKCICKQISDWTELKLGRQTYFGTLQAWLTLDYALLNSYYFLASDWSKSFHAFVNKLLIRLINFW